ncbi:hypothetical protein T492DRAFT_1143325 [Pavlovales sp. CCMP2436]|nr:hypothetical protein T492DRAFT_1143325 [Pavlovales sp. CCMP2436]
MLKPACLRRRLLRAYQWARCCKTATREEQHDFRAKRPLRRSIDRRTWIYMSRRALWEGDSCLLSGAGCVGESEPEWKKKAFSSPARPRLRWIKGGQRHLEHRGGEQRAGEQRGRRGVGGATWLTLRGRLDGIRRTDVRCCTRYEAAETVDRLADADIVWTMTGSADSLGRESGHEWRKKGLLLPGAAARGGSVISNSEPASRAAAQRGCEQRSPASAGRGKVRTADISSPAQDALVKRESGHGCKKKGLLLRRGRKGRQRHLEQRAGEQASRETARIEAARGRRGHTVGAARPPRRTRDEAAETVDRLTDADIVCNHEQAGAPGRPRAEERPMVKLRVRRYRAKPGLPRPRRASIREAVTRDAGRKKEDRCLLSGAGCVGESGRGRKKLRWEWGGWNKKANGSKPRKRLVLADEATEKRPRKQLVLADEATEKRQRKRLVLVDEATEKTGLWKKLLPPSRRNMRWGWWASETRSMPPPRRKNMRCGGWARRAGIDRGSASAVASSQHSSPGPTPGRMTGRGWSWQPRRCCPRRMRRASACVLSAASKIAGAGGAPRAPPPTRRGTGWAGRRVVEPRLKPAAADVLLEAEAKARAAPKLPGAGGAPMGRAPPPAAPKLVEAGEAPIGRAPPPAAPKMVKAEGAPLGRAPPPAAPKMVEDGEAGGAPIGRAPPPAAPKMVEAGVAPIGRAPPPAALKLVEAGEAPIVRAPPPAAPNRRWSRPERRPLAGRRLLPRRSWSRPERRPLAGRRLLPRRGWSRPEGRPLSGRRLLPRRRWSRRERRLLRGSRAYGVSRPGTARARRRHGERARVRQEPAKGGPAVTRIPGDHVMDEQLEELIVLVETLRKALCAHRRAPVSAKVAPLEPAHVGFGAWTTTPQHLQYAVSVQASEHALRTSLSNLA